MRRGPVPVTPCNCPAGASETPFVTRRRNSTNPMRFIGYGWGLHVATDSAASALVPVVVTSGVERGHIWGAMPIEAAWIVSRDSGHSGTVLTNGLRWRRWDSNPRPPACKFGRATSPTWGRSVKVLVRGHFRFADEVRRWPLLRVAWGTFGARNGHGYSPQGVLGRPCALRPATAARVFDRAPLRASPQCSSGAGTGDTVAPFEPAPHGDRGLVDAS